jgi:predicted ATPase
MNINSDIDFLNKVDIEDEKTFPIFLKKLRFEKFRHIPELEMKLKSPISVISGTNRSGKSTILMAIACSHFDFKKRNSKNGKLERHTWSSLMKFTSHDVQKEDWTYHITYKTGKKVATRRGQRKKTTKKWNGIGKKESQYKMRQAIFIDLDRIVPARFYGDKIYNMSKNAALQAISAAKVIEIEKYLSYVLEENFEIKKLAEHLDKDVFKYNNSNQYSSYNAASGEEVLTRIIIDLVEAPKGSLVLIDEIEMGLHPKVQRRLVDVLRNICRNENKQFIVTTHSGTILDAVSSKSRIFIEKNPANEYRAIQNISVSAALSKMDAKSFPLIDLYCEDDEAKKIIRKGIKGVEKSYSLNNFNELINIIVSGSADKTFANFTSHKNTYSLKKVKSGFACILDGDMKTIKDSKGNLTYEAQENLHFLYSNECPEKFLAKAYLSKHPNVNIEYYLENENPHYLFQSIIENSDLNDKDEVFNYCWKILVKSDKGKIYFKSLKKFLVEMAKKYSPEL